MAAAEANSWGVRHPRAVWLVTPSPGIPEIQPLPAIRPMPMSAATLRELYEGDTRRAHLFRYALLVFDVATIAFVVVTSFLPLSPGSSRATWWWPVRAPRLRRPLGSSAGRRYASSGTSAPGRPRGRGLVPRTRVVEGVGFLRILRTLRLLRTYHLLERLRKDSELFRRNEDAILAATNLVVFVFVMTGIVYATQHNANPAMRTPVDALYFTVTSLTNRLRHTPRGRRAGCCPSRVMICGVTLFLPPRAGVGCPPLQCALPCTACGLQRHEPDAVHCKACATS